MVVRVGSALAAVVVACSFVIACSGGSTGTTGGASSSSGSASDSDASSGGNGSSSGSSGKGSTSSSGSSESDECKLEPGFYTISYTTKPGGVGVGGGECNDLPDQTFELKPNADGGTVKPSPGCTIDSDEATCTTTTNCEIPNNGYTTTSESVLTITSTGAKGSQTAKTVKDDDGSVLTNCSYDFIWTKK